MMLRQQIYMRARFGGTRAQVYRESFCCVSSSSAISIVGVPAFFDSFSDAVDGAGTVADVAAGPARAASSSASRWRSSSSSLRRCLISRQLGRRSRHVFSSSHHIVTCSLSSVSAHSEMKRKRVEEENGTGNGTDDAFDAA